LAKEFGGRKQLAEVIGCKASTVNMYCSPAYLNKHGANKETWEKYFGSWDSTDQNAEPISDMPVTEEVVQETADVAPVVTEQKQTTETEVKRKARLVIEVPSLEELEETLASFGFRLEFIPR
jgi:hypothetical protein